MAEQLSSALISSSSHLMAAIDGARIHAGEGAHMLQVNRQQDPSMTSSTCPASPARFAHPSFSSILGLVP
uniref:Uncharacterized protein n=1 Tax=Leersia perrieri TaxID=77586 RepID=A0A0D9VLV2_9ORYZ